MRIIYIDSLFVLNLLADYVLLVVSARVAGAAPKRLRCLLASGFGALSAVLSFVRGFYFLSAPPCRLALAGMMGLIAFGGEARLMRCICVFLAVSASFGGAVFSLGLEHISLLVLAVCFLVCYTVLTLISLGRAKLQSRAYVCVTLRFLGRECRLRALVDSGNCLTDPISGADMIIVRSSALSPLFGAAAPLLEIREPVDLVSASAAFPELSGKLRLIPYSALGGGGMLPVFRPQSVDVDGLPRSAVLCAVDTSGSFDGFDAVIGS